METTHNLLQAIDEGTSILPVTLVSSSHIRNSIMIDIFEDTYDGIFPRVSDWTRFANSIDRDGIFRCINRLTPKKNKLSIELDGFRIIRTADYQERAILEFTEPLDIVFGKVGEEFICKRVKRIRGYFTYDWYWIKSGRQSKIANGLELYFNIEEYLE